MLHSALLLLTTPTPAFIAYPKPDNGSLIDQMNGLNGQPFMDMPSRPKRAAQVKHKVPPVKRLEVSKVLHKPIWQRSVLSASSRFELISALISIQVSSEQQRADAEASRASAAEAPSKAAYVDPKEAEEKRLKLAKLQGAGRARGKNQLSSLLSNAISQREDLEERIALAKSNKRAGGAKYVSPSLNAFILDFKLTQPNEMSYRDSRNCKIHLCRCHGGFVTFLIHLALYLPTSLLLLLPSRSVLQARWLIQRTHALGHIFALSNRNLAHP